MDPLQNEDGTLYAPTRYKELVRERVLISKNINTSYIDVGKITPLERKYIIQFLREEAQERQKMIDEMKSNK